MGRKERKAKESQEKQLKGGKEDEKPQKPMGDEQQVTELNDEENKEKTLVQRAVQVGLVAIPISVYVSWAYKKFFPCPRVKCKPQPKGKRKLKSSSKPRIPFVCSMLDSTMKRYCTNGTNAKQGIAGNNYCECRHIQKLQRHEDPCEMLRYDVRDESYDRGASGRSKNPFASFYEDDFREEVEANRQEQSYTQDRYRERKHVPERKGRVYKNGNSAKQNEELEIDQTTVDCASLEETIQMLEENKDTTKRKQNSKKASHEQPLEGSASEKVQNKFQQGSNSKIIPEEQSSEECEAMEVQTPIMNYCEYLKRPILDYDPQEYPKTDKNVKNSKTGHKPGLSKELVVNSPQAKSSEDGNSEGDPSKSTHFPVNISQEVMDSLCEQYSREYRKSLSEQQNSAKQDFDEGNLKTNESTLSDCCGENSETGGDAKNSNQDNDRIEDVCSDKSIQEIIDRYKSVESKQETSSGENDFETVGSAKAKSYDDLCDANFHSLDSDTPFVVKDYTCKTTIKRNDASEDKPEEDYENRQKNFWHSCKPPKGLKKGCHPSKDKGPCD
ncbi:hypothetical protein GE061_002833 [Apolygus lucorum]|uniref:Uncharacterized protein n=1 Tax=Apolygus lucorum TaxID=248454 RepID=A0A6A4JFD0_APOLU|nr:hypothetical protein GE061_002833 [Apolygus lucorum]